MPVPSAQLFDAMAADYDVLEPWYAHLYAVLHEILPEALDPGVVPVGRALDAGCGTGFQAARLEALGYRTHGADLSAGLLAVARRRLQGVRLARADLEALPYADSIFDAVACCGSTLSFVDDPARALAELGRVLRPGGRLLLECERRWSLDLGWALLSGLAGDVLGYGLPAREVWRALARRPREGVRLDYPGYPGLRLFTGPELVAWLRRAGLRPVRTWGIHAITNLIPSTVLHREHLPRALVPVYGGLRAVDRALAGFPPARRLASSLVLLARKPK